MKEVIYDKDEQNVPIKMWLNKDDLEENALKQITNVSKLPFAFKHVALMPDAHTGYGCPIGSVFASEDVIVPNLVGSDSGCGMTAIPTNLKSDDLPKDTLKKIMSEIRKVIPVGFKHNKVPVDKEKMPFVGTKCAGTEGWIPNRDDYPIVSQYYESARHQIGTLGGGK